VTNQKIAKNDQILQNGQMRFFMASAVKKWPNFSKLAIKWPIWQHCPILLSGISVSFSQLMPSGKKLQTTSSIDW